MNEEYTTSYMILYEFQESNKLNSEKQLDWPKSHDIVTYNFWKGKFVESLETPGSAEKYSA